MSKVHAVNRLANKYLYNQPLLMTQNELEDLLDYVEARPEMSIRDDVKHYAQEVGYGENSIAMISIEGALSYKAHMFESMCEMSSYQTILSQTREAIKLGYKTLVYDTCSGGGEAYGAFECSREIQSIAKANGVKTIAYVDKHSASAAYALNSSFDEIVINPAAKAGSIGVVVKLKDTSEADSKAGMKDVYIFAGDSKIPYDEEGKFSKDFLEEMQTSVDSLYEDFLSHVSEMRGIEKEAVRSTQAKMYNAKEALELGLVDKIMTRMEFAEYLATQEEDNSNMDKTSFLTNVNEEKTKMSNEITKESLDAAIADKDAALSKLTEQEALVAELTAKNEALSTEVSQLKDSQEQSRLSQRKAQLAEVLSEDKLDATFEATKDLDEVSFGVILGNYSHLKESLSKSDLFEEQGVGGEVQEEAVEQESSLMKMIKSQKKGK